MNNEKLLTKLKNGDKKALSDLYLQFNIEFIHWLISKYHCSEEEARDIYQHAILVLYRNVIKADFTLLKSSIKTYLFGIGKNTMLNKIKSEARFSYSILDLMDDQMDNEIEKEHYELKLNMVHESLKKIGEPCKSIIELSYFNNLNLEMLKTRMGHKNTDTTKNVKYKCMQRLRRLVKGSLNNMKGGKDE